jgi:hypothetical protein
MQAIPTWSLILIFYIELISHFASDSSSKKQQIIEPATVKTIRLIQNAQYMEEIFELDTLQLFFPAKLGLGKISAVHMTTGGDIIIVDRRFARTVLVFNNQGKFVRQLGRQGRGPGEYLDLAYVISNKQNEIIIGDYALSRISFFAGDGRFLSSFNVPHRIEGLLISEKNEIIVHNLVKPQEEASIKVYSPKGKLLRKFGNTSYAFQEMMDFPFRPTGPYLTLDRETFYQTDYPDYHIRKYWNNGLSQFEFGVEPKQYRSPLATNYKRAAMPRGREVTPEEDKQLIDYLNNEFSKCTYVGCILTLCSDIVYTVMINQAKSGFEKSVYCVFYDSQGKLIASGLTFKSLSSRSGSPLIELMAAPPGSLFILQRKRYTDEEEIIQLITMHFKDPR